MDFWQEEAKRQKALAAEARRDHAHVLLDLHNTRLEFDAVLATERARVYAGKWGAVVVALIAACGLSVVPVGQTTYELLWDQRNWLVVTSVASGVVALAVLALSALAPIFLWKRGSTSPRKARPSSHEDHSTLP